MKPISLRWLIETRVYSTFSEYKTSVKGICDILILFDKSRTTSLFSFAQNNFLFAAQSRWDEIDSKVVKISQ